jgi:hypothetical protein
MQSIKVTQNGQKSYTLNLPTSWQDIDFCTAQRLFELLKNEPTEIDVLAVLCGTDIDIFKKIDLSFYFAILENCKFVNVPFDWEVCYSPQSFFYNGLIYELPTDIGAKSLGQYEDVLITIKNAGANPTHLDLLKYYPEIIGIYLQPSLGSEYDNEKVQKMLPELEKCSFQDIVAFANFFFTNTQKLKNGTKKIAKKASSPLNKLWQGMTKLQKSLVLYFRSSI